ncbi:hypothetical protein [Arthrobacter sp. StoSoilB20]|uniref:hypothetical protein n=1 Tax=Arthrobacter sp. StoSoilB20 TaxID=2830995 RepID=UPI001CC455EE|nr:hypothetical protein [Arthrobacter sp. StoSoilB20]
MYEPASVRWGECGDGRFEVFGGFDVGEGVEHLQQFGDVLELREPALEFEPVTAGYGEFHFFNDLGEGRGPGVEVLDPGYLEKVRAQVALHYVHFRDVGGVGVMRVVGGAAGCVLLTPVRRLQVFTILGVFFPGRIEDLEHGLPVYRGPGDPHQLHADGRCQPLAVEFTRRFELG